MFRKLVDWLIPSPGDGFDKDSRAIFQSLTLALLGVIQGLALNHLAEKIGYLETIEGFSDGLIRWGQALACFMIIVRVFQTYFSASLFKVQAQIGVLDLVSVFAVGVLQYWIISAIKLDLYDASGIYFRIMWLAISAIFLHGLTTLRIVYDKLQWSDENKSAEYKRAGLRSEYWNISIAALITLVCFLSIFDGVRMDKCYRLFAAWFVVGSLAINIWRSLADMDLSGKLAK